MLALILTRPGSTNNLRVAEVDRPEPGPGQVLIRVAACGLNPVDSSLITNGHPRWVWPQVLGVDVAGTVDAVGNDVRGWAEGERVAYHGDLRVHGGFAEYTVADPATLARVPDALDLVTAAALPCAGLTAYQAIHRRLRVDSGQTVLITGGNGGVGGYAIQLAAATGATVITTVSSDFERPLGLGAIAALDYRDPQSTRNIRAAAGEHGIDAGVDTVSGANATKLLNLLNHGGGIACVAGRADLEAVGAFTTAPSVHEIALGAAYSHGRIADRLDLGVMLADLMQSVASGRVNAAVSRVITTQEVPAALQQIGQRHGRGKTVLALPTS